MRTKTTPRARPRRRNRPAADHRSGPRRRRRRASSSAPVGLLSRRQGERLAEDGKTKGVGTVAAVDLPEKDINQIVVADAGNQFALFRKPETFSNTWELTPTDVTTGKSAGKHRIRNWSRRSTSPSAPDGKYVMVEQEAAFGRNDRALTISTPSTRRSSSRSGCRTSARTFSKTRRCTKPSSSATTRS